MKTAARPPADSRPCVVVTTYARPDGLALLLADLEREAPAEGLDVRVYDDGTPNPDLDVVKRIRDRGWRYLRAETNRGKRGWWRWWNEILKDLRRSPAPLFYVVQDDMRLCREFFERSLALWDGIDDPQKASLDLHVSAERGALGSSCWTPVRATRCGEVVHSGWLDCNAVLCNRRLFRALDWRLEPIAVRRWHGQEFISSGVGQQISLRAHRRGLRMYRTAQSLTVHDGSPSLMNPEARRKWTMHTVDFVDGDDAARALTRSRPEIFASLASIPPRERGLESVVASLLPQVDRLGVYLNGYRHVPRFLDDPRIVVARSREHGDRGDAGKFFWAGSRSGYQLVCDDDLAYPSDYVARLVDGIERYGRRAVVGFHGSVLREEIVDYHASRRLLHFARPLERDTPVHVLGTAAVGYHTAAMAVAASDFRRRNTADIWLALLGQRQEVPFVCLRRPGGWLTELPGLDHDSIYRRARAPRSPRLETRLVRAHAAWRLHGAPQVAARSSGYLGSASPSREVNGARPEPPASSPPAPRLVRTCVRGPDGVATLVLPERDHITEAIRRSGTYYERDLLDAVRSRARSGVFVDVGAHFGNHTTYFGLECGADRVVALEPNPSAFAGLLETVAENALEEVVVARRVAVHPTWRRVALVALPWTGQSGAVRTNSGRVGVTAGAGHDATPAAPLDEILVEHKGIAVIKVDAEGLSSAILSSGLRTIRRDRPLIAAEAASDRERRSLRALLAPLGYRSVGRYCWTPTWLWEPIPVGGSPVVS